MSLLLYACVICTSTTTNIVKKIKSLVSKLFLTEVEIVPFSFLAEKDCSGNGQYYFAEMGNTPQKLIVDTSNDLY